MGNTADVEICLHQCRTPVCDADVTISDSATKAIEDDDFTIETYGHASALHAFDLDTASVAQTGDSYPRLGAPAGASVSADIAAVQADTNDLQGRVPTALTGAGHIQADMVALEWQYHQPGDPGSLRAVDGAGTVGSGSTTTSIVTSSLAPAATVADQFKGRVLLFSDTTTTANLRGQSADITASTSGGVLTISALTTAAVAGDDFVIV